MAVAFRRALQLVRTAALLPAVRAMATPAKRTSKKLFTPGPLGVSMRVKEAMLRDMGSRDVEFVRTVKEIRSELLKVGGVSEAEFTCIPVQGSGTFAVESVITTSVPRENAKLLVIHNGAYGQRVVSVAKVLGIPTVEIEVPEKELPDVKRIEAVLRATPGITNVAMVHCETSSGMFNPVEEVGRLVHQIHPNASYFVDAMSSFGAVPLDLNAGHIDYLVSSANKCVQGVPGFSYVLARRAKLAACKGNSRSLSLDLVAQNAGLDANGQFRFTPATHSMMAFREALRELDEEGGPVARAARYQENRRIVKEGMAAMGFKEFLAPGISGYIITSFLFPTDPNFNFEKFYSKLNEQDLVIYPGKVTKADSFRIGHIGDLHPADSVQLIKAIEVALKDMGVVLPLKH